MVSVEQSLLSLSDVSRVLHATPDQVEQAAEKLALTLPMRFRGVLFFDGDSIERIRHHLKGIAMAWKPQPRTVRTPAPRLSSRQRGYDSRWDAFSLAFRREFPLCQDCEANGMTTPSEHVHRRLKLRDYPQHKFNPEFLVALCASCHDRRTARGE